MQRNGKRMAEMSDEEKEPVDVLQVVEQISRTVERVGMDETRAALGEVFETLFMLARSHPELAKKRQAAFVLVGLWAQVEQAHLFLSNEDSDAAQLH